MNTRRGGLSVKRVVGAVMITSLAMCSRPTTGRRGENVRAGSHTARSTTSSVSNAAPAVTATRPVIDGEYPTQILPSGVEVEGEPSIDAWLLLDHDASTALTPGSQPWRVHMHLAALTRFTGLAVYGPFGGDISVSAGQDGSVEPLAGLQHVHTDASANGWTRFDAGDGRVVNDVVIEWNGTPGADPLREIELWGRASGVAWRPGESSTTELLEGSARVPLDVAAEPTALTVSPPELAHDANAGTAHVHLDVDPRSLTQAFLVYELSGLPHWSAARRSINGREVVGGAHVVAGAAGGRQVEEISPAWLRRGDNELRFAPSDPNDAVGYEVRSLRVVGTIGAAPAADVATEQPAAQHPTPNGSHHASRDRNAPTEQTNIAFAAPAQPSDLTFRIEHRTVGSLEVGTEDPGGPKVTVALDGLAEGWHHVPLRGVLPGTTSVEVRARLAPEATSGVRDISVAASPLPNGPTDDLVVTYPAPGECLPHDGAIRGFARQASGSARPELTLESRFVAGAVMASGEFAVRPEESDWPTGRDGRELHLEAAFADGHHVSRVVRLERCAPASVAMDPSRNPTVEDSGAPFGVWVRAGEAKTFAFGDYHIEIPAGAVDRDVRITVRPLTTTQLPPLEPGMTNVTPGHAGVRLGPHHLHFARPIHITLPYDHALLPPGMLASDVNTYFYDEGTHHWRSIPRTHGDVASVQSATEHFTDFISATLAVPDHPQAASFNPNMMHDLRLADPAAGVTTIAPPTANSHGTADLEFPIWVPPGRHGLQPSLAITYDSDRTNSWMGVGWDLDISHLEVDTRFGVPHYDGTHDIYLLDGAALTPTGTTDPDGCALYQHRVEGSFDHIRRCGLDPTDYHWEVMARSGVTYFYGRTTASRLANPWNSTIARWQLDEVRDLFGNSITYTYVTDDCRTDPTPCTGEPFLQIYPSQIRYTNHVVGETTDLTGDYLVTFVTMEGRQDVIGSGRTGFDVRTRRLLQTINVEYNTQLVRTYALKYGPGDFGRTLLQYISVGGTDGNQAYTHQFTYFQAPRDGSGNMGFAPARNWGPGPGSLPFGTLSRTDDASTGSHAFVGMGPVWGYPHGGIGTAFNVGEHVENRTFLDVDGDGVPDVLDTRWPEAGVFSAATGSNTIYRGTLNATRDGGSFATAPITMPTDQERTFSPTFSMDTGVHLPDEIIPASADFSVDVNVQDTLLIDANGDGRVDVVQGPPLIGDHHVLNVFANPFAHLDDDFGSGADPDFTLGGFTGTSTRLNIPPDQRTQATQLYHTAPVVRWTAQLTGPAHISGAITLPDDAAGAGVHAFIYRVTGNFPAGLTDTTTLWSAGFAPSGGPCTPSGVGSCSGSGIDVDVNQGDRLYFIVSADDDPSETRAMWDPVITMNQSVYDPATGMTNEVTNTFQRSVQFRVADPSLVGWIAPLDGTVELTGTIHRADPTEDIQPQIIRRHLDTHMSITPGMTWDMVLNGFRTNPPTVTSTSVFSPTFGTGATDTTYDTTVTVQAGDALVFRITRDQQSDPSDVSWSPLVTYTQVISREDSSGTTTTWDVAAPPCTAMGTSGVSMCMLTSPTYTGPLHALPLTTVQRAGVPAIGPTLNPDPNPTTTAMGLPPPTPCTYSPSSPDLCRAPHDPMVGWYRGWAAGEWRMDPDSPTDPEFTEMGALSALDDTNGLDFQHEIDFYNANNFFSYPRFLPMGPRLAGDADPGLPTFGQGWSATDRPSAVLPDSGIGWVGTGLNSYITSVSMHPSAAGVATVASNGDVTPSSNANVHWSESPGLRVSFGFNAGGQVSFATIDSESGGNGVADSHLEFFDFNGDGRPDSVGTGSVQFQDDPMTDANPEPSSGVRNFVSTAPITNSAGTLRHVVTTSSRYSINIASPVESLTQAYGASGRAAELASMMPSFSHEAGTSVTTVDWVDINGDGLPDLVQCMDVNCDSLSVQLNFGYRLGQPTTMALPPFMAFPNGPPAPTPTLQDGDTNTNSLQFGYAGAGGGPAYTSTRTWSQMIDINGDGLPDRVVRSPTDPGEFFQVCFNLGDHFAPPVEWTIGDWPVAFGDPNLGALSGSNDALTYRSALRIAAGYGYATIIPLYYVSLALEFSGNLNLASEELFGTGEGGQIQFSDIDGDGRVDHILEQGRTLYAKLNQTGRSNLLQRVSQPLGGSFELDYYRQGNRIAQDVDPVLGTINVDMPHNEWALHTVTVHDGFDTGSGHDFVRTFDYHDSGFYDRVERENYGYAHVTTTLEDFTTIDQYFHNQDYYCRGLLKQTETRDSGGHIYRVTSTTYATPPTVLAPLHGEFFPSDSSTRIDWYEGTAVVTGSPGRTTHVDHAYDAFGNLITSTDVGEIDDPSDDVTYTIGYQQGVSHYFFHPNLITARDGSGTLLRQRGATYDDATGALRNLQMTLNGGRNPDTGLAYSSETPTWTFSYDAYGNIQTADDPRGYELTYAYDVSTESFCTSITDSFGYTSTAMPNLAFGVPAMTTDINGQQESFVYDTLGRVTEIRGPYDIAGTTPTVRYVYGLQPGVSLPVYWARTQHIDVAHPGGTIDTITFIDGIGRVIQTKRSAEVDDGAGGTTVGWSVSGHLTYDSRGRVTRQGQPAFDTGVPTNIVAVPETYPTQTTYDILGRTTQVVTPDSASTQTSYGFADVVPGTTRLSTTVTDPLSRTRTTYHTVRDQIVGVLEHNHIGGTPTDLLTRYSYDPMGDLVQVVDAAGNTTTAEYDTLGQRTALANPDTGRVEYLYDLSGNLGARETPNLRARGALIHYRYDYNRLRAVEYPDTPATHYYYGGPGGAPPSDLPVALELDGGVNGAGRIIERTDAGGFEMFGYGELGETTFVESRLTGLHDSGMVTAVTRFQYDSFGRVLSMTYPDGDLLCYSYDSAGQLTSGATHTGDCTGPTTYTYFDQIAYDTFGQRTRIHTANGMTTTYTYDPTMRRLSDVLTDIPVGGPIQREHYTYNLVGNITALQNEIPTIDPVAGFGGSTEQTFTYDDLDQLTNASGHYWQSDGSARQYTQTMTYDAIGNITHNSQSDVLLPTGGGSETIPETSHDLYYYYGSLPHAPMKIGERAIQYDADGNQLSWTDYGAGTSRTLAWDEEDRITSITDDVSRTEFAYNASGQRTQKYGSAGDSTVYVNQFYSVRNAALASEHVFAGSERIATLTEDAGATTDRVRYFYASDHLQSTHYVLNDTGTVLSHDEYFPFGESWILEKSDLTNLPHRFTGHEIDWETGLYYFGARYYDPVRAQWVSPDPVLDSYLDGHPNNGVFFPKTLSLFTYAGNGPVAVRDPDGRFGWAVLGGAIGVGIYAYRNHGHMTVRGAVGSFVVGAAASVGFTALAEASTALGGGAVATAGRVALAGGTVAVVAGIGFRAMDHGATPQSAIGTPQQQAADGAWGATAATGGWLAARFTAAMMRGSATTVPTLPSTQAEARAQGFGDSGTPVIVDENLQSAGVTAGLRSQGYNVRSVAELFPGESRVSDERIMDVAERVGGRVLTRDVGHDIGGGFGRRAITVDHRAGNDVPSLVRYLESAGVERTSH